MRRTYRATVAYDGTPFVGFAKQRGLRTVESTLLDALQPIAPDVTALACGGRTDRGVHATGQVVSFYTRRLFDVDEAWRSLDAAAPEAMAVRELREVPRSFHASFSATGRRYVCLLDDDVDVQQLHAMLQPLVGKRCFSAFARDTPAGRSTVRQLWAASARRCGSQLRLDFHASGFLRRQVRVTVATAVREVRQGAPTETLQHIAETGDRTATARPIDATNVYLAGIDYNLAKTSLPDPQSEL